MLIWKNKEHFLGIFLTKESQTSVWTGIRQLGLRLLKQWWSICLCQSYLNSSSISCDWWRDKSTNAALKRIKRQDVLLINSTLIPTQDQSSCFISGIPNFWTLFLLPLCMAQPCQFYSLLPSSPILSHTFLRFSCYFTSINIQSGTMKIFIDQC